MNSRKPTVMTGKEYDELLQEGAGYSFAELRQLAAAGDSESIIISALAYLQAQVTLLSVASPQLSSGYTEWIEIQSKKQEGKDV